MWWEQLSYLDELCRAGSMTAAARTLGVDKATVSRRVAELEHSAPAPLFERRQGAFELTPYGVRALSAFRDHERARQRLANELEATDPDTQGAVRVTAPTFFACELLVPALPAFLRRQRGIAVQMYCSSRVLDLTRAEADVGVRNVRPTQAGLAMRKVGRLGLATYAAKSYLAERGGLSSARGLQGHDLISYDTGPYGGPGFEWLPAAAQEARLVFSANDALSLRDAARAGLGIAVLPHFLGDAARELVRLPDTGEGVVDIWLVTREEQKRVARVRAVVQFLADLIGSHQQRLYAPA
jgi:DNA-binding transcriptional LysR family regulator